MNIVSFFAPVFLPHYPDQRYDYRDCLRCLEASCRAHGYRHIVITDETADLDHECFRPPLTQHLMTSFIAGQLAYLKSPLFDADTVLVGADCFVHKPVEGVFSEPFDIAVTGRGWGPEATTPINHGAVFCRHAAKDRCVAFFEAALAKCETGWGGDQNAISAVCAPMPDEPGLHERSGVSVRFFDCLTHNFPPDNQSDPRLADALIWHFKGPRKNYMRKACGL